MKEILNVYKIFAKKSPKESIGCFIFNHLPSEGFIIPYMYHAYFIVKSDILVPDKILLTHHTQKPKVFFIQPLVLNQEIQDPKNTLKIVPEFFILDNFIEYIKDKYGARSMKGVNNIVINMINSLSEFIEFESY